MSFNFSFVSFRQHSIHRIAPVLLLVSSLFFFGGGSTYAASSKTSRYEFKGVVKLVNRPERLATIKHEEIKDYVRAMTMPFLIRDSKALQQLQPGDQIKATLIVRDDGAKWLEKITIITSAAAEASSAVVLQGGL